MRIIGSALVGMSLAVAGLMPAMAQDASSDASSMPKVLHITREFIKPGKSGLTHDKSEAAFVQASERAKYPTHYFAVNAMSGDSRALYMFGFDSFAAVQKDVEATASNETLAAAYDRAEVSDGELLSGIDDSYWVYNSEQSYHAHADAGRLRYLEISAYYTKPGHDAEWSQIVKMVQDTEDKIGSSAHWAVYDLAFGGDGELHLVLTGRHGMDEIDQGFGEGKKFDEAMGEDGMKKFQELIAETIVRSTHQLYAVNPRQSYPDENWVKEDPSFWRPKPMMRAGKECERPAKAHNAVTWFDLARHATRPLPLWSGQGAPGCTGRATNPPMKCPLPA